MNVLVHIPMCTHFICKNNCDDWSQSLLCAQINAGDFLTSCAATSVCLATDSESPCCIVYSTALQKCIGLTG